MGAGPAWDKARPLLATLLVWAVIAAGFAATTADQYGADLCGDARTYALMAMNYRSPSAIDHPLPVIYTSRLLPALVVGWFAGLPSTPALHPSAVVAIADGFRCLNIAASGITVAVMFLTLRRLAFSPLICATVSLSFMSLFLSFRLYLLWPEMADPLGFSLLVAMVYCVVAQRWWPCIALGCLSAVTRENALFALPCVWLGTRSYSPGRRLWIGASALVPILVLFTVRRFPYFPSEVLPPNAATSIEHADSYVPAVLGWTRDYADILVYSVLRSASARAPIASFLLGPSVFGVHGVIVALGWRQVLAARKSLAVFAPFVLATLVVGSAVDRYLFYLFPVVLIATAAALKAAFPVPSTLMRFVFVAAVGEVVLYDHWLPVQTGQYFGDRPFADAHQVEFLGIEELNRFAAKFVGVSAVVWAAWRRWATPGLGHGAPE